MTTCENTDNEHEDKGGNDYEMVGSSNDEYDINDGGGDDDDDDDIDDLSYANSGGNIKGTRQNVDSLTDEYHTDFKPELDPFYYTGDNTIPTTISHKDASLSTFDISNRKRHMKRLQKFITCKSKECLKRRDLFFDLNQSTAYNDILRLLHSIQFEVTKANELAIKELLLICYPVFLTHSDQYLKCIENFCLVLKQDLNTSINNTMKRKNKGQYIELKNHKDLYKECMLILYRYEQKKCLLKIK
jgi:hypothetical protein